MARNYTWKLTDEGKIQRAIEQAMNGLKNWNPKKDWLPIPPIVTPNENDEMVTFTLFDKVRNINERRKPFPKTMMEIEFRVKNNEK